MKKTMFVRLEHEHQEIIHNLEQTVKTLNQDERYQLFTEARKRLVEHMNSEDLSIYRHFQQNFTVREDDHLVHTSESEHHQIEDILQRLPLIDVHNPKWDKWIGEFLALVREHRQEKEIEMFQKAKEKFSQLELDLFTTEIEEDKHR